MVVHCTPCTSMYTRLHNTRRGVLDTAVFRQQKLDFAAIVSLLHAFCLRFCFDVLLSSLLEHADCGTKAVLFVDSVGTPIHPYT